MSIFIVYLLAPCLLYCIRPAKSNYLLVGYWVIISLLSYDNVTDYFNYYQEFVSQDFEASGFVSKGREYGWILLVKTFSFWRYGYIIVHAVSLSCVLLMYFHYSKRYEILNISILLYFLLNLVTMHDNTWRQNISMSVIYFVMPMMLGKMSIKSSIIVLITIMGAAMFHYSALLMIPLWFVIRWLSRSTFNVAFVLLLMVVLMSFRSLESVNNIMNQIALLLSMATSSDLMSYYSVHLQEGEAGGMGISSILLCLSSCIPLLYYKTYGKNEYANNQVKRFCVNACCFVAIWRTVLNQGLLVRPAEYLMWPYVWGYSFFIVDAFARKRYVMPKLAAMFVILFAIAFAYKSFETYYGDSHYMTVLSEDCAEMKFYTRYTDELQHLRVR